MKTSFEKDLLEAALKNLEDGKSKLRLNNFAYSACELTRHYLKRLAPDTESGCRGIVAHLRYTENQGVTTT